MTPEEIDRLVDDTMTRLSLNRDHEARYDAQGEKQLLDAFHHSTLIGYQHGIAHSLMFLGRLLEVRGYYPGARLLYLKSRLMFLAQNDMFGIPAFEYFRECPKGGRKFQALFEQKRVSLESGALDANLLVAELFGEGIKLEIEQERSSFWRRLFRRD